jgi:glycosyltransferase involved in cell wall biosynthesis
LWEQQRDAGVQIFRPVFAANLLDKPGTDYWEQWLKLLPATLDLAGPNTILWVFSPHADLLVEAARDRVKVVVYDCMDDLASFADGTEDMREKEDRLLSSADVVTTGGHSMYLARKDRHPRVHAFPSGVEIEHYRSVRDPDLREHPALAQIPHPRLGYFGVLDERIDWQLIETVALERPAWHWTLVGPTAKVDPGTLPTAPNIHYLGKQQYADLPAFLKGFDIATMPFALNRSTKFISPTKTLEYLAGGKPVISSSVPDVVAFYDKIVHLADGPAAWIATISRMLSLPESERRERAERAQAVLAKSTWDNIAARMWALVEEQVGAEMMSATQG